MKCQNCGKNEVNFHYASNINGNITEKYLCAECADKLGYNREESFGGFFDGMMPGFFRYPGEMLTGGGQREAPAPRFGFIFPALVIPQYEIRPAEATGETSTQEHPEGKTAGETKVEVDSAMKQRREINVLREQMRAAAESEDFEKAAEIRDTIKKMESENSD